MKPLSSSHLVIAAALTVLTTRNDAQISLTLDPSQNSFICGDKQILICKIEPYASTMTWTKDTFANPLASCSPLTCEVNPSMSASYNFTFDTGNGIFHMEILTVKVADNGTIYSCDNGFESETVTSNVAVKDDCRIVKENKTIGLNTTKLSVSTGCIRDNAVEDVTFEWWVQDASNTSSEKMKFEPESITYRENSTCISDPNCGVSGYSFVTNSINITDSESGKNYSIGVDVTCGGSPSKPVPFELFFYLNYTESSNQPPSITTVTQTLSLLSIFFIVLGTVGGVCLIVSVIYITTVRRKKKKNRNVKKTKYRMQ